MALLDKLLKTLTNPYLLAAAGGVGGYYVKGRDAEGFPRYAWIGGGAVAGFALGQALQRSIQATPAVAVAAGATAAATAATQAVGALPVRATPAEEMVDFTDEVDVDAIFNPATASAAPAATAQKPAVRPATTTQSAAAVGGNHLGSLSSGLDGDLEGSFGSFADSTLEVDEGQLQDLLEEGRGRN